MKTDRQLLEEFAATAAEEAFRSLVTRHLGLVHSVARRVTGEDDLAKDISQSVFSKLAGAPACVPAKVSLVSWLHQTTRHLAIDLVRSENRRRRREVISHHAMNEEVLEQDWKEIEPFLDEALSKLPERDRSLIIGRYYQRNSHARNGEAFDLSEDAARVRTSRALEKLRSALAKRGVSTTAALLGSTMTSNAFTAASPALVSQVTASALANITATSAGVALVTPLFIMAKIKLIAPAAAVVVLGFAASSYQSRETRRLNDELAELKELGAPAPVSKPSSLMIPLSARAKFHSRRSQQFDKLVGLFRKKNMSLLGTRVFSQSFEPSERVIDVFSLTEEQTQRMVALGQVTLQKIQAWELENIQKVEPADPQYQHAFEIAPDDDLFEVIATDFRSGVRKILGAEAYLAVESGLESGISKPGTARRISFKFVEGLGGESYVSSRTELLDPRTGGSRGSGSTSQDREFGIRFSHLVELATESQ